MQRGFFVICAKCGREIPDDAVLCCYCGRIIVKKQPSKRHARGNGSGCAYKRGKTWTAQITVGWELDENGKKHQRCRYKGGFKTKNQALEYIPVLKSGLVRGSAPNLLHYWQLYRDHDLDKLSASKRTAYKIAWEKMTSLQYKPVDAITVQNLRDVVAKKAKTYYPARDMKVVLHHLFRLAGADRWVDKDLPEFIILPELSEKEREPFTDKEQESLWKLYDAGDRRAAIPLIMIYTGMMPGEIQGLKRDMVDIDRQRIIGAGMKTKVRRESPIYLPDPIIPVLIDEMARSTSAKGYIWLHNETKFYENYYAALEAAGCRRLEPYSCRHTTATALAITEGVAPQTVRKIMRWSSTRMLDRYTHPDDQDARDALKLLPAKPTSAAPSITDT